MVLRLLHLIGALVVVQLEEVESAGDCVDDPGTALEKPPMENLVWLSLMPAKVGGGPHGFG